MSECKGCCQDHNLLHNVRHRGSFARICTSCVLKFNPGYFCPACVDLFDGPPPPDLIKCSKCPAAAHPACVRPDAAAPAPAPVYVCPSCSNPSFSFFDASRRSEARRVIDGKAAKALLGAARIAAVSMSRAANSARLEAEKKVKEAAFARKRAREALEHVSAAAAAVREKKQKGKEAKEGASGAIVVAAEPKRKTKAISGVVSASSADGRKRVQSHRLDGLLPDGIKATAVVVQRTPKKAVAAEAKDKLPGSPSPSSVLGRHHLQNHAADEGKDKIPAFSASSAVDGQQQQSQNSSCLLKDEEGEKGKPNGFTESETGPHDPPLPKQDASVSMANQELYSRACRIQ